MARDITASLAKLRTNGFVVSEPRGAISFTDLYYRDRKSVV